jgi:hypothetical protein
MFALLLKKRNVQIFGGTQKYFGGTSMFRGTQVEKHCPRGAQEAGRGDASLSGLSSLWSKTLCLDLVYSRGEATFLF